MQPQDPKWEKIPSLNKDQVKGGDILVPLRLLTNSALLLDKKIKLDEGRFLDFCTFVTAFALHDRIITLRVDHIPDELLNTSLFSYLTDEEIKILHVLNLNVDDFAPEIRGELEVLFGQSISKSFFPPDWLDEEHFEHYFSQELIKSDAQRKEFIDQVIDIVKRGDWNRAIPYAANRTDEMAFCFRTALYTKISETLSIPLILDFTRIPIIKRYHARIQKSLRMFIQAKVDEPAMKQLDAVREIIGRWPIPVASPVSKFLKQYSSPNIHVGEVLENMRSEFDAVRAKIIECEDTVRHVDTIGLGKVLEVLEKVSSDIRSIQDERGVDDWIFSFAPAIGLSVDPSKIVELARSGHDLSKVLMARKRMDYFKTGKDEATKTVRQQDLLRNAFDYYLTETQAQRFLDLSNYLEKLTSP